MSKESPIDRLESLLDLAIKEDERSFFIQSREILSLQKESEEKIIWIRFVHFFIRQLALTYPKKSVLLHTAFIERLLYCKERSSDLPHLLHPPSLLINLDSNSFTVQSYFFEALTHVEAHTLVDEPWFIQVIADIFAIPQQTLQHVSTALITDLDVEPAKTKDTVGDFLEHIDFGSAIRLPFFDQLYDELLSRPRTCPNVFSLAMFFHIDHHPETFRKNWRLVAHLLHPILSGSTLEHILKLRKHFLPIHIDVDDQTQSKHIAESPQIDQTFLETQLDFPAGTSNKTDEEFDYSAMCFVDQDDTSDPVDESLRLNIVLTRTLVRGLFEIKIRQDFMSLIGPQSQPRFSSFWTDWQRVSNDPLLLIEKCFPAEDAPFSTDEDSVINFLKSWQNPISELNLGLDEVLSELDKFFNLSSSFEGQACDALLQYDREAVLAGSSRRVDPLQDPIRPQIILDLSSCPDFLRQLPANHLIWLSLLQPRPTSRIKFPQLISGQLTILALGEWCLSELLTDPDYDLSKLSALVFKIPQGDLTIDLDLNLPSCCVSIYVDDGQIIVNGHHTINVSGAPPIKIENDTRMEYGGDGLNGVGGNSGGHIFISSSNLLKTIDHGLLALRCDGGNGGDGLPGQPGRPGLPGKNHLGEVGKSSTDVEPIPIINRAFFSSTLVFSRAEKPLQPPGRGERGGMGGMGGMGGKAGDLVLFDATLGTEIHSKSIHLPKPGVPGNDGLPGNGGPPGEGGRCGLSRKRWGPNWFSFKTDDRMDQGIYQGSESSKTFYDKDFDYISFLDFESYEKAIGATKTGAQNTKMRARNKCTEVTRVNHQQIQSLMLNAKRQMRSDTFSPSQKLREQSERLSIQSITASDFDVRVYRTAVERVSHSRSTITGFSSVDHVTLDILDKNLLLQNRSEVFSWLDREKENGRRIQPYTWAILREQEQMLFLPESSPSSQTTSLQNQFIELSEAISNFNASRDLLSISNSGEVSQLIAKIASFAKLAPDLFSLERKLPDLKSCVQLIDESQQILPELKKLQESIKLDRDVKFFDFLSFHASERRELENQTQEMINCLSQLAQIHLENLSMKQSYLLANALMTLLHFKIKSTVNLNDLLLRVLVALSTGLKIYALERTKVCSSSLNTFLIPEFQTHLPSEIQNLRLDGLPTHVCDFFFAQMTLASNSPSMSSKTSTNISMPREFLTSMCEASALDWPAIVTSVFLAGGFTYDMRRAVLMFQQSAEAQWPASFARSALLTVTEVILACQSAGFRNEFALYVERMPCQTALRLALAIHNAVQNPLFTCDPSSHSVDILFSAKILLENPHFLPKIPVSFPLYEWADFLCRLFFDQFCSEQKFSEDISIVMRSRLQRRGWKYVFRIIQLLVGAHIDQKTLNSDWLQSQIQEEQLCSVPILAPRFQSSSLLTNSIQEALSLSVIKASLEHIRSSFARQPTNDDPYGIMSAQANLLQSNLLEELLLYLGQLWFHTSGGRIYAPRPDQLEAAATMVRRSIRTSTVMRIMAGEGKTWVIALYAAVQGLLGDTMIDIITDGPNNALQSYNETKAFFHHLFGSNESACLYSDSDSMSFQAGAMQAKVVYGDPYAFKSCFLHQFTSAQTASHMTGYTERYSKFHVVRIIDEIDAVAIDSIHDTLHLCNEISDHALLSPFFIFLSMQVAALNEKQLSSRATIYALTHWLRSLLLLPGAFGLFVPPNLLPLIHAMIPKYIESAILSRQMPPGQHFNLRTVGQRDQIVPYVLNLGLERFGSQWTMGLTQFLELLHDVHFTPPFLHALSLSQREWLSLASGQTVGLSGTLGSGPILDLIFRLIGATSAVFFSSAHDENLARIGDDIVYPRVQENSRISSKNQHVQKVLDRIQATCSSGRPQLLIVPDVSSTLEWTALIRQHFSQTTDLKEIPVHQYCFNDDLPPGSPSRLANGPVVFVGTHRAGRGLNVGTPKSVAGGLDVCIITAVDFRRFEQAFRRTARNGHDGTACAILDGEQSEMISCKPELSVLHAIVNEDRLRNEQVLRSVFHEFEYTSTLDRVNAWFRSYLLAATKTLSSERNPITIHCGNNLLTLPNSSETDFQVCVSSLLQEAFARSLALEQHLTDARGSSEAQGLIQMIHKFEERYPLTDLSQMIDNLLKEPKISPAGFDFTQRAHNLNQNDVSGFKIHLVIAMKNHPEWDFICMALLRECRSTEITGRAEMLMAFYLLKHQSKAEAIDWLCLSRAKMQQWQEVLITNANTLEQMPRIKQSSRSTSPTSEQLKSQAMALQVHLASIDSLIGLSFISFDDLSNIPSSTLNFSSKLRERLVERGILTAGLVNRTAIQSGILTEFFHSPLVTDLKLSQTEKLHITDVLSRLNEISPKLFFGLLPSGSIWDALVSHQLLVDVQPASSSNVSVTANIRPGIRVATILDELKAAVGPDLIISEPTKVHLVDACLRGSVSPNSVSPDHLPLSRTKLGLDETLQARQDKLYQALLAHGIVRDILVSAKPPEGKDIETIVSSLIGSDHSAAIRSITGEILREKILPSRGKLFTMKIVKASWQDFEKVLAEERCHRPPSSSAAIQFLQQFSLEKVLRAQSADGWWRWDAFFAFLLSAAQIAIGIALILNGLVPLGQMILSAGISDILYVISAWATDTFSWSSFFQQKALFATFCLLSCGVAGVLPLLQQWRTAQSSVSFLTYAADVILYLTKSVESSTGIIEVAKVIGKAVAPTVIASGLRSIKHLLLHENIKALQDVFAEKLKTKLCEAPELKQLWMWDQVEHILIEAANQAATQIDVHVQPISRAGSIFCVRTPALNKSFSGLLKQLIASSTTNPLDDIVACLTTEDIQSPLEVGSAINLVNNQMNNLIDVLINSIQSKYKAKRHSNNPREFFKNIFSSQESVATPLEQVTEQERLIAKRRSKLAVKRYIREISILFNDRLQFGLRNKVERNLLRGVPKQAQFRAITKIDSPKHLIPKHIQSDPHFLLDDVVPMSSLKSATSTSGSFTSNIRPKAVQLPSPDVDDQIVFESELSEDVLLTSFVGRRIRHLKINGLPLTVVDFFFVYPLPSSSLKPQPYHDSRVGQLSSMLHSWPHSQEQAFEALPQMKRDFKALRKIAETSNRPLCLLSGNHNPQLVSMLESSIDGVLHIQHSSARLQSAFGHLTLSGALIAQQCIRASKEVIANAGLTVSSFIDPISRSAGVPSHVLLTVWSVSNELRTNPTPICLASIRNVIEMVWPLQEGAALYEKLVVSDHPEVAAICRIVASQIFYLVQDFSLKPVEQWSCEDVIAALHREGLSQYATIFSENRIRGRILIDLTDSDLQELGVQSKLTRARIRNMHKQYQLPQGSKSVSLTSSSQP